MKNKLLWISVGRILICLLLLTIISFLLITGTATHATRSYIPTEVSYRRLDDSCFYEGIGYGTLLRRQEYYATVIHPPVQQFVVSQPLSINCRIGALREGAPFYETEEGPVKAAADIYITDIAWVDHDVVIDYFEMNKDYVIFYGDICDYTTINIGDTFIADGFADGTISIVSKEKDGNRSIFCSQTGDYSQYYRRNILVKGTASRIDDVFYINNIFLTNPVGENQYQLYIMNKYQESQNPDDILYFKIITVEPFDNTYSIITSHNVNVWERVFYYSE